jgi:acyl carrier protein
MTKPAEIERRVLDVIALVLKLPDDQVTPDISSAATERWDSLKHMMIVLAVEEEFGIEFLETEIPNLVSARALMLAVARRATSSG